MSFSLDEIRVVDLFAGCGGLSLGFQNAGFKIIAACDVWEPAIAIYRKNFHHPIYCQNLEDLDSSIAALKLLNPNLIIGGPPCQDFSSAGKRDENLGSGSLTIAFAEIVADLKPKWFVLENVSQFPKSQKYQQAKQIFKSVGYGLSEKVLDASLCGVPQIRKRFFWIGELDGQDHALRPFLEANLADKPMTVQDYLGNSLGTHHYYRHPRSYQRRGIFSIDEPSPTVRGVNRPVPKTYQLHPGDSAPVTSARPLTTLERSYLQTFPQSFIFDGSKTELEQMIGNAVPVKLAEYVALCIKQYFQNPVKTPDLLTKDLSSSSVASDRAVQLCLPVG
jgi:DNA (cytosine-5)-methyltransferase 1